MYFSRSPVRIFGDGFDLGHFPTIFVEGIDESANLDLLMEVVVAELPCQLSKH